MDLEPGVASVTSEGGRLSESGRAVDGTATLLNVTFHHSPLRLPESTKYMFASV